jgi:rod shape-determining protein MreD
MDTIDRAPGIRPRPSLGRRLDAIARALLPTAATVVLMLLAGEPLGFPNHATLLPAVAFGSVYFWSVTRPECMPPHVVFVLGLLLDLLGYLPLGVGVISLLVVHALAARWRHRLRRQRFLLTWGVFAGIAISVGWLGWALVSLLRVRLMPAGAALFQIVVTVALYPTLAVLFGWGRRVVADAEPSS